MANDTTHCPWNLDTQSATAVTTDRVRVEKLLWEGGVAGQICEVRNSAGHTFWKATNAAGEQITADFDGRAGDVDGFVLIDLDGGVLSVYFA